MNFFDKVMTFLKADMQTPEPYGLFHLISIAVIIGLTIFVSIKFKNSNEKQNRRILLTYAIICLVLEVYKQLVFSYNVGEGWSYRWYAFPFQLCSTPMYIGLIAALVKKGKFQQALFQYLITFSLLAGTLVMALPSDIYVSTIGINIQTTIHHGLQIVIGVYLMVSGHAKLNFKSQIGGVLVFIAISAIALIMNIVVYNFITTNTFNMFFISPYFPSTLPVFSIIYPLVPFPIFLLIYVIGFAIGSYMVLYLAKLIKFLGQIKRKKAQ